MHVKFKHLFIVNTTPISCVSDRECNCYDLDDFLSIYCTFVQYCIYCTFVQLL